MGASKIIVYLDVTPGSGLKLQILKVVNRIETAVISLKNLSQLGREGRFRAGEILFHNKEI